MAEKLFVNHTGHPLKVQLIVRQGDDPMLNADPVDFDMGAGKDCDEGGNPDNVKLVSYGDENNIYLNGIVVGFEDDGSEGMQRFQVIQRGVPLDDKLNTNNTIMFVYHGSIQIEASNSIDLAKEAAAQGGEGSA